jgi:hypothetical protein
MLRHAILLIPALYFAPPASAFVLLKDEYFPRSEFSALVSKREEGPVNARLLTAIGRDDVETVTSAQKEKRYFAALGLAAQAVFFPTDKIRLDFGTHALRSLATTEIEENSGWNKSETSSELVTRGFVRYQLDEGFRLGAGASWLLRPSALETFDFSGIAGRLESQSFNLLAPECLLQKESAAWSVGLGWRPKASASRRLVRSAASETESISEDVVLEELWSAGVATQLQNGRQLNLDLLLSGVGESQKRDPATGKVSDEGGRRRYEITSLWGLNEISGQKWSLGVGYQSMAYTDQASVSPHTIPLWNLLIRNESKLAQANARFDGLVGYGSDKQSLPDMNATYRRLLFSVQAGLVF